jgi:hypothetical protein
MRAMKLAAALTLLTCLAACTPRTVRYRAGLFQIDVPTQMPIEAYQADGVSYWQVRGGPRGPVCAVVRVEAYREPCSRAAQRGALGCANSGRQCNACVDDGSSRWLLQAWVGEEPRCLEAGRELLASLRLER